MGKVSNCALLARRTGLSFNHRPPRYAALLAAVVAMGLWSGRAWGAMDDGSATTGCDSSDWSVPSGDGASAEATINFPVDAIGRFNGGDSDAGPVCLVGDSGAAAPNLDEQCVLADASGDFDSGCGSVDSGGASSSNAHGESASISISETGVQLPEPALFGITGAVAAGLLARRRRGAHATA